MEHFLALGGAGHKWGDAAGFAEGHSAAASLALEHKSAGQVAERTLLVSGDRSVAHRDAVQGRQLEAARDEAQDRGRVHRRVVDDSRGVHRARR